MKNKSEIGGFLLNILAVIALLLLIVVGLNLIGLYKLPAPLEKLLGTYEGGDNYHSSNDSKVMELIDKNVSKNKFVRDELSYENAYKILNNLSVGRDYSQDIVLSSFYENKVLTEKVNIKQQNGLYEAVIYDSSDNHVKTVKETEDGILIEFPHNADPISVPKGNFEFSQECGFILDVKEFLASDFELDEASFSQFSNDDGSFISVSFDYSESDILYNQEYVISLDFGVVTEAKSFYNQTLVYEMKTEMLSDAV